MPLLCRVVCQDPRSSSTHGGVCNWLNPFASPIIELFKLIHYVLLFLVSLYLDLCVCLRVLCTCYEVFLFHCSAYDFRLHKLLCPLHEMSKRVILSALRFVNTTNIKRSKQAIGMHANL